MNRTRIQLRTESRSADTSPSRLSRDAQSYSRPNESPLPNRPKDDIVLNTNYGLFSPQSKAEATQSLARVMEIQRQASMMPHYSSLVWLDQFVQTRALEENTRYQQVPERSAPFENLYHDLASMAAKNNERCQPLQCPNFPKLPKKKSKRRASMVKKVSRSNDTSPTRIPDQYGYPHLTNHTECQKVTTIQLKETTEHFPNISFTCVDQTSFGSDFDPKMCPNNTKQSNKCLPSPDTCTTNSSSNNVQTAHNVNMRKQPQNLTNIQPYPTHPNQPHGSGYFAEVLPSTNSLAGRQACSPQQQLDHLKQCLGGEIEDISCSDLDNLDYQLYFLILQKLQEKAKAIEKLINETDDIKDLEKQLMKVIPAMNLVRTLVKLSSLYQENYQGGNNAQETVLSKEKQTEIQTLLFSLHRQDFLLAKHTWEVSRLAQTKDFLSMCLTEVLRDSDEKDDLIEEMREIRTNLKHIDESLYSCNSGLSLLEHNLLVLRQELQCSAQSCMTRGGAASLQTLAIERELREVQQRATELQKKGNCLIKQVEKLIQKQNQFLKDNVQRKVSTKNHFKSKINVLKTEPMPIQAHTNYYYELKKASIKKGREEKQDSQIEEERKNPQMNNSLTNAPSDDSLDSDQKYLDLIDLLTVKMFQSDTETKASKDSISNKSKKSNSLPRMFEKPEHSLHKSSSQTFLTIQSSQPSPDPSSQLSAYERLFGKPRGDSRSSSPIAKEKKKMFIPKHNSRVRHTSGSQERPAALDILRKMESKRLSSKSEENVSIVGREKNANQTYRREKNSLPSNEIRSSKLSLDSIDSLFAAPAKIVIPERLVTEEVCPALSREEQMSRESKADMVRRMVAGAAGGERERLLAINQVMARQVVKKRNEMAEYSSACNSVNEDEAADSPCSMPAVDTISTMYSSTRQDDSPDLSPDIPLPVRQQRETFLT